MKLYLSSYRVPNLAELATLVGKPVQAINMALIPNAKDYYAGRARIIKRRQVAEYFVSLGFKVNIVDLQTFDNAAAVVEALQPYDLIWAMGGNSFILRYEMQRSGFDEAIKKLLAQGKVYGGDSAGAIVVGNSLVGIEPVDDPEFAEQVIPEGLGLTNHFILPHVGNADFADAIEKAREIHHTDTTKIELTDNEAYIVEGDTGNIVKAPSLLSSADARKVPK